MSRRSFARVPAYALFAFALAAPAAPLLAGPPTPLESAPPPERKPEGRVDLRELGRPPKKTKLTGPPRPTFTEVRELDYSALPLMKPWVLSGQPEEHFALRDPYEGPREPRKMSPLVAPPPQTLAYRPSELHAEYAVLDAVLRVGDALFVPNEVLKYRFAPVPAHAQATWFMIDNARVGREAATVRRYAGPFDGGIARAESVEYVRAVALIPGELYAFRHCMAACDAADEGGAPSADRREEIGIVTPRAGWTGASDGLTDPNGEAESTFHAVRTAEIAPGSSATLSAVLDDPSDLPRETALRTSYYPPPRDLDQKRVRAVVDLELVWEAGGEPALTLSMGSVEAKHGEVGLR